MIQSLSVYCLPTNLPFRCQRGSNGVLQNSDPQTPETFCRHLISILAFLCLVFVPRSLSLDENLRVNEGGPLRFITSHPRFALVSVGKNEAPKEEADFSCIRLRGLSIHSLEFRTEKKEKKRKQPGNKGMCP